MIPKIVITVALCRSTSSTTAAEVTSGPVDVPYMRASRLVTVDGNRFNIYCTGHGSPTVVLDSNGDDGTAGWRLVQPKIARRIEVQSEHPSFWRAFTSRDQNVPRSSDEVVREQKRYGNMPLIVLTTTKDIEQLPIPHPQKTRLLSAWIGWHDEIASLSTVGTNFVVTGSSSIPIDNPGAVLAAVYEVLLQIRH